MAHASSLRADDRRMKRHRIPVRGGDDDDSGEEDDGEVGSDSGDPRDRHVAGAALGDQGVAKRRKTDSGVVYVLDAVKPTEAKPAVTRVFGERPASPLPAMDVETAAGQSAEMLRLLRQPRYYDDDFEAVRQAFCRLRQVHTSTTTLTRCSVTLHVSCCL